MTPLYFKNLSIFRALNRSNKDNIFCDTLSLEEKFQYESVHNKFCKSVLGLKKTASNIAAKSELGRFTLDSFIKIQVMMYLTTINLSDIDPLVKEAFNINKYLLTTKISEEFNFDFRDRPFNLEGGGDAMFFFSFRNIFFGQHESESDYIIFLHQSQNIFSATLGIRIFFFRKKNITPPPFKLNGRSHYKI